MRRQVPFHKMSKLVIPRKTVYRLSLYYRALQRLKANKVETVSSAALAKAAGVKPTQLRKDLTYFGQFGTRGLGYSVASLSAKLTEVLGTTHLQPADSLCLRPPRGSTSSAPREREPVSPPPGKSDNSRRA